ncbi:MAG: hypothetical protein JSS49_07925 [Planctomycetes bacterium]|nr:hypothetical protein [Planctomycetota bacterium]
MKPFKESSFVVAWLSDGANARVINGWDNVLDHIDAEFGETVRNEENYLTGPESNLHDRDYWNLCDGSPDGDNRFHFLEHEFGYCVGLLIQRITTYGEDQVGGELEVGIDPTRGEVVINLGEDRVGHIGFNPDQARYLAGLLERKANDIQFGESGLIEPCPVCSDATCNRCCSATVNRLRNRRVPELGVIHANGGHPEHMPGHYGVYEDGRD